MAADLSHILEQTIGVKGSLSVLGRVAGGSINSCYRIAYAGESFFLKVNSAASFPDMFRTEASGLMCIGESGVIRVPGVIASGIAGSEQYLLLEWIEQGPQSRRSQEALGVQLARLHKVKSKQYGLDHDNYMGSLPQWNKKNTDVGDFYISCRLKPQLDMMVNRKLADKEILLNFDKLFKTMGERIPAEAPSLIHGDLWAGNFLITSSDEPLLIDPAISFFHREADIAMTSLFGGFEPAFYHSYNEEYPLQAGWKERTSLWNLYPLLVHVNLFGASYLPKLVACLNRIL